MTHQSEAQLEKSLIERLERLGFGLAAPHDELVEAALGD